MKNIFNIVLFFLLIFCCSCYDKDSFINDYKLQRGSAVNIREKSSYVGDIKYGNQNIKIHSVVIEKQNLRFDDKTVYSLVLKSIRDESDIGIKSVTLNLINDIEKTIEGEYQYYVPGSTFKHLVPRLDSGSFTLSNGSTKYIVDVIVSGKVVIQKNSSKNLSVFFDLNLNSGKKITGLLISDFSRSFK